MMDVHLLLLTSILKVDHKVMLDIHLVYLDVYHSGEDIKPKIC